MAYSTEQMTEANAMAATLGYPSFERFIEERISGRVNINIGKPGDLTNKQAYALDLLNRTVESALTGRSPNAPKATPRQVDFLMSLQDRVLARDGGWERRDRSSMESLYKDEASRIIDDLQGRLG